MNSSLTEYILHHSEPEPELLQQLSREAHRDLLWPRMISGHLQGRLLYMFCQMIKPKCVLEIGTFAGYSALCMAEALDDHAELHTIEINDELEEFFQRFFDASPHGHKIIPHIGDALDIIPTMNLTFDLVFIDGNKRHYTNYYNLIFDKVNPGGYIIADNILWDGKVVQTVTNKDKQTQGIIDFNTLIQQDDRVENIILPIRDGMMLLRKK